MASAISRITSRPCWTSADSGSAGASAAHGARHCLPFEIGSSMVPLRQPRGAYTSWRRDGCGETAKFSPSRRSLMKATLGILRLCLAAGVAVMLLVSAASAQKWSTAAPFPEASEEVYGIGANGKLYVFGGLA